ncbi:MAG: hypothetical protein HY540_06205 [Deltaproteobacteria bacterium]|nr:hypothetical protein [Deltaproteobacteria bacterium]
MKFISATVFLGMCFLFISCGGARVDEGENFGNILESDSGLTLTESEHAVGWGKAECTICHNLENIHLVDRSGGLVDVNAIRERTLTEGEASCVDCHGTNGIP